MVSPPSHTVQAGITSLCKALRVASKQMAAALGHLIDILSHANISVKKHLFKVYRVWASCCVCIMSHPGASTGH